MTEPRRPMAESLPPLVEFDDPDRGRLSVASGEIVVLLGASGAGKTRLIRSLLGLTPPGAVGPDPLSGLRLRGRPVGPEGVAPVAGWVPEGDGVFLSDTVGANVARPSGAAPNDPAAARDALDLVGLAARAGEPVAALSRGQRRRVALARALASRRPFLVVDGELDPTIWTLLPAVLAQAPWVEGALLATASTAAVVGLGAAGPLGVALVGNDRIVTQGRLSDLRASTDPDVRGVLTWVE